MKSRRILDLIVLAIAAICAALLNGCGGGSANVVSVAVTSSSGTTIIVGSSTTLTATVTGATNLGVTWETPQYTTTTTNSSGKTTTSSATNIPSDGSMGTLTNQTTTSPATATYTAPAKLPSQTTFPGLQIIITAQSQQNTGKTGNVTIVLDSGIGEGLTPTTATVPTNEPQPFTATLTNDNQGLGVTFLLTQQNPNSTSPATPYPQLTTCSPNCGSIQSTGLYTATYTAPSSIPTACNPAPASSSDCTTPADLTIVATSKADNTRFLTGTITVVQGGPITFNGITPTIAPQGAAMWDVYLNAPNISSASKITITDQNGGSKTFTSTDPTNQIKVTFPLPTSSTANPTSSGARLRLLENDLLGSAPAAGTVTCGNVTNAVTCYTFSITDPGEPVTTGSGSLQLALMPVRPTVVSSTPNSVVQNSSLQNNFPLEIDGGYFGPGASLASVSFQGNTITQASTSNSRQFNAAFPSSGVVAAGPPGLYPLSVTKSSAPPASVTTVGVFPDYSMTMPAVTGSSATGMANPSAVDIDPTLGVIAVAEVGASPTAPGQVEFFSIGAGTLTSLGTAPVGVLPTGLSVNRTNHTVAVINYGSKSVSVVAIPGSGASVPSSPIDLSGVLQGVASPAPLPYAIGVDPDTNLALVAFSCTSISCIENGNLGFVVNLNQGGSFGCLQSGATPPCVFAQVTLNTGAAPQIAMAPHGHIAYVTPGEASLGGGSSTISGIDVTHGSTSDGIISAALTAGVVTITTTADLTGLVPGIPATVLISGMPTPPSSANCPAGTNFNGIFQINLTGNTTFTYVLVNLNGTGTCTVNGTSGTSNVFYGTPSLTFTGINSGAQGIAINPITHTAAVANPNATTTGQQIDLLNQLDSSVTSISFTQSCTFYNQANCPSSGSDQGNADVAWQPYTNSVVSYNPQSNQLSISDPVSQTRRAFACTGACSTTNFPPGAITLAGTGQATLTVQNGTTNSLTLFGGVAVDPATNQAFVVQSGSGTIQLVNLGAIKSVNITEVVVPSASGTPGTIGGLPGGLLPQGTLTSTTDLAGVQIFGSGFAAGAQVLLDGNAIPSGNVTVDPSGRKITATIPATPFLSMPHRFALTVNSGGSASNPTDFFVIKAVSMTPACSSGPPNPSSVAIADQLGNNAFAPIAVVTNTGCGNISVIDINPASGTFGTLLRSIPVGASPQGVAISQVLGLAVVANNGDGTASIIDLVNGVQKVAAVPTGANPTGVAINDSSGAALVANFGANTVSVLNLGLLFGSSPATSLTATGIGGVQQPLGVAIDPDAGTNNQGLAVVSGLQTTNGSSIGALFPVDIGLATPVLSTTVSLATVSTTPTGIVFDPAAQIVTTTTPPTFAGRFFVTASGEDTISSYDDSSGSTSQVNVGINPTALAVNPQTGAILTSNFAGQSASIVDTLSNPFATRQTLGIPGSAQFGVAIDQFTNLAVIVDQGNNRVLLFAMPN